MSGVRFGFGVRFCAARVLVVGMTLAATGCVLATGDGQDTAAAEADSSLGTVSQELVGWNIGFNWNSSMGTMTLKPKETHVCVLTKVAGKFAGFGESVRVTTDSTNWILEGQSQQDGVWASAQCFQRDAFTAFVNGTTNVVRKEFALSADTTIDSWSCFKNCELETAAGNAFTFLEGGSGKFSKYEFPHIEESNQLDTLSVLRLPSSWWNTLAHYDPMIAYARAFRVGDAVHPALYMDAGGNTNYGIWYVAENNTTVPMAPYDKAMCAFTEIGGEFNGLGESVNIFAQTGADNVRRWMLSASSLSGTGTFAGALCFARDQR